MTNEPSLLPWRVEGKCIYTAHGDFIGEMEHTDDARIVVDAVNWYCDWGALSSELERLRAERDRLRDIVRRMVETLEQVYKHADMTDYLRAEVAETQREARAAIGEGETPKGKGVGA